MDVLTVVIVAFLLHVALYFTDYLLHSCLCLPYMRLLQCIGVTVQPLQLRVTSTCFNRPLAKYTLRKNILCRHWYSIGSVVSLVLLLPSVFLLLVSLFQWINTAYLTSHPQSVTKTESDDAQHLLQPVVPGVNLGVEELPAYLVSLLVASAAHEAGHALAALSEGVPLEGVGFLLFFILPGAFVLLPTDALAALKPTKRLRILCAGVWHNIVLVGLAYVIAYLVPVFLLPVYSRGHGAVVMHLTENSPARGINGLNPYDVVTGLNGCSVADSQQWHDCVLDALVSPQNGFCISDEFVYSMDETSEHISNGPGDTVLCCTESNSAFSGGDHLCFELLTGGEDATDPFVPMHPFSCLPAKPAIASSLSTCRSTAQCSRGQFCLAPSVESGVRLLRISRASDILSDSDQPAKHIHEKEDHLRNVNSVGNDNSFVGRKVLAFSSSGKANTTAVKYKRSNANQTVSSKALYVPNVISFTRGRVLNTDTKNTANNIRKKRTVPRYSHSKLASNRTRPSEVVHIVKRDAYYSINDGRPSEGKDDYLEPHDHLDDVPEQFRDVLYLGSPVLLYQTVVVSDYLPRQTRFFPLGVPDAVLKFCDTLIKFSGALALLNLVPCVFLDGQHILGCLIEIFLRSSCNEEGSVFLKRLVTAFGTALVVGNLILEMIFMQSGS